jgi:predicted phosphodiesterase
MNQFFFVGCWNRENCKNVYTKEHISVPTTTESLELKQGHRVLDCSDECIDYRSLVFKRLEERAKNYQFGIITGDNIYPKIKIEKEKKYYKDTLNQGYNMLQKIRSKTKKKQLYGVVGNHDVGKASILSAQLQKKEILDLGEKNVYMKTDIHPGVLRIIFIDTNILSQKRSTLYDILPSSQQAKLSLEERQARSYLDVVQPEQLFEKLTEYFRQPFSGWTIVVGHEPLYSVKYKKKKLEEDIHNLHEVQRLHQILSSQPKTIYICADVHSFQVWNTISKDKQHSLPIVIAGTGGGHPDENISSDKEYIVDDLQPLEFVGQGYPYGICSVRYDIHNLWITYEPIGCLSNKPQNAMTFQYKNGRLLKVAEVPVEKINCTQELETLREKEPLQICNIDRKLAFEGGSRKVEYIMYYSRRYKIRMDEKDRRKKYIQTKEGRISLTEVKKQLSKKK